MNIATAWGQSGDVATANCGVGWVAGTGWVYNNSTNCDGLNIDGTARSHFWKWAAASGTYTNGNNGCNEINYNYSWYVYNWTATNNGLYWTVTTVSCTRSGSSPNYNYNTNSNTGPVQCTYGTGAGSTPGSASYDQHIHTPLTMIINANSQTTTAAVYSHFNFAVPDWYHTGTRYNTRISSTLLLLTCAKVHKNNNSIQKKHRFFSGTMLFL